MKKIALLVLVSDLVLSLQAFSAEPNACSYAETVGSVEKELQAHEPKEARSWAPLSLALCNGASGQYLLLSYNAVGLGRLMGPPLRSLGGDYRNRIVAAGTDQELALIADELNERSGFAIEIPSEYERNVGKYFEAIKGLELLVVYGSSKTQYTVYRRQPDTLKKSDGKSDRVYSNVLFLKGHE